MPPPLRRNVVASSVIASGCITSAWLLLGPRVSSTPRLALLCCALAAHIAATVLAWRHGVPSRVAMPVAVLVLAIAVALSPQGSKDLWAYAMQGRIVTVYHANPYVHRPSEYPNDPALTRVAPGWRASRSPYGPVFVVIEATGAAATGASALAARVFYQGLAAAAVLAVALALCRRSAGHAAVVFLAMSPAVVAAVNGGHNDVLVGAGIAAAVALTDRRRVLAAGLGVALVALVKVTALVAALALAVWVLRSLGRGLAVRFSAVVAGVFVAGYGLVGGFSALDPIRSASARGSRAALLAWPRRQLTTALVSHGELAKQAVARTGNLVMLVALACVVAAIALVIRSGGSGSSQGVVVGAMTALVLMSGYVLPWYVLWLLPAAAMSVRTRASVAAWMLASALLIAYNEPPGIFPSSELTSTLSHVALPLALLGIVVVAATGRPRVAGSVGNNVEPHLREPADA